MSDHQRNSRQQILLLITVGAQDLKVWTKQSQDALAEKIPFPGLRDKHLAIRNNPGTWTVVTKAVADDCAKKNCNGDDEAERLAGVLGCKSPLYSTDGRLCLAAAKIDPIVQGINAHKDKLKIVGAVLFYTERLKTQDGLLTEGRHLENEPIASADVARRYLLDCHDLSENVVKTINWMENMTGRFEGGLQEHDDFPLRRKIVALVDREVQTFLCSDESLKDPGIVPVTLTTGGADAFKQLLPAIAELRFRARVRDLSTPETDEASVCEWGDLVSQRLCTKRPRITRHEAITARGRALELLRQGDPVSAWATVHRYEGSKLDQWWLQPLAATAAYFGGAGSDHSYGNDVSPLAPGNESATDTWRKALSEVKLSVKDDLEQHKRYALNAAMRVELALQGHNRQSRRYADALAAVCSMIDAAVIAKAILFLREDNKDNMARIEDLIEEYSKNRDWFFLHKNAENAKGKTPNNSREAWFGGWKESIKREYCELHKDLTEHFADLIALEKLLGWQDAKGHSLRGLRNTAAHRALSNKDITRIEDLSEKGHKALWGPPGRQNIGEHALGFKCTAEQQTGNQPEDSSPGPILAVLKSIGYEEPADVYQRLVGSLESILLTCESETGP